MKEKDINTMNKKITIRPEEHNFARIDFVYDGEEDAETYYIGRFGFIHPKAKYYPLIYA